MSTVCEPCGGIGYSTTFFCGPADPEAPLTGEMSCDVHRATCSACHGKGRISEQQRRQRNIDRAKEDTRLSGLSALARARASYQWSKQP